MKLIEIQKLVFLYSFFNNQVSHVYMSFNPKIRFIYELTDLRPVHIHKKKVNVENYFNMN